MICQLLAEAAAPGASDMNYLTTGAITALGAILTGALAYSRGKATREVTIDKQPVGVRLHEAFVTRTEFLEFRGEIKTDVREIRAGIDRLTTILDERDKKLSDMIERVASGAFEGRRRIHEEVNAQGKQIAAIGVNADISKGLTTLGKAIMSRPCNQGKPPTPPHP